MKYILFIILLSTFTTSAQDFIFKIRKVPELNYFVFADGFSNHNLDEKTQDEINFPQRLYIQIYDNDTFLIRWSNWKLKDANIQFDYLIRDSLTFTGKIKRQGEKGMKLVFPYEDQTYNMFSMGEEPLVKTKEYEVGPVNEKVKRVKFSFEYNKKVVVLADLLKKEVDSTPEILEALKISARIKMGFYSNDLYNDEKRTADLPFNIVDTYPVRFILSNSETCSQNLFWKGITTTKTINLNDTSKLREDREWVNSLTDDVLIDINGSDVEYYKSRRYVYLENDSQIFVSKLNRGCNIFRDSLDKIDSIPIADFWDARDGINNYLVNLENGLWGWASIYSCAIEWRIYERKKIRKILKQTPKEMFKRLINVPTKGQMLLNEICE
tara:strand:+ start:35 stop:1180 length:1146 start_codon:yes stop_codon:yes gene_type:complete